MKVGAYQFAVSGDIDKNLEVIKKGIAQAVKKGVHLLVFPECALTGYIKRDIEKAADVDFEKLDVAYNELQELSDGNKMCIIVGTITKEDNDFFNCAAVFRPKEEIFFYEKRALWGWDKDNFTRGSGDGMFEFDEYDIGVRLCYEVRFPEFFREMYEKKTFLNIIMFYDVADEDDVNRYDLIKSHIRTRASENVVHTLSVDAISPYQTAPTALYDRSGNPLVELNRNEESLLVYDLEYSEPDFGETGRMTISDWLDKYY